MNIMTKQHPYLSNNVEVSRSILNCNKSQLSQRTELFHSKAGSRDQMFLKKQTHIY